MSRYALSTTYDNSSISFLKTGYKESDDPTYQEIENGNWYFNEAYGTIHRIASTGKVKRLTKTCFDFCHGKCNYLRIDIHKIISQCKTPLKDMASENVELFI